MAMTKSGHVSSKNQPDGPRAKTLFGFSFGSFAL